MTNQASKDELDTFMKQLGFFWDSYQSNWRNDGRKQFGIDYDDSISMQLAKQLLAHIRTEKLMLLAEVRERVVGENVPHFDEKCEPDGGCVCYAGGLQVFQAEQLAELTKLEAEL